MFVRSKNTGSGLLRISPLALLVLNVFPPPTEAAINLADIECGKGATKARSSRIIGGSSILFSSFFGLVLL